MTEHPGATTLLAVGLVGVLGAVDWATGSELSFSAFYLLPVTAVAWSNNRLRWVAVSVISAAVWLIADITAGQEYSNRLIPIWNTAMRLGVFLLVGALFAALRRTVAEEREVSMTDALTGVLNTREFHRRGVELIEAVDGGEVTVMFFDLDDFKLINEAHGHTGGDEVLRHVGDALLGAVRSADVVGRLGGDEFGLLFVLGRSIRATDAIGEITERVRAALAGIDPPVTFSAGAVTFPTPPASVDTALDEADRLMYEVKRSGKGSVLHRTVTTSGFGSQPEPGSDVLRP